jgi:hypothetical protein
MSSIGDRVSVELSREELALLCDALDSHEYWQLGDDLPRSDGFVFLPGDAVGQDDRYWSRREPSDDERIAIESITRCRVLVDRIAALLDEPRGDR